MIKIPTRKLTEKIKNRNELRLNILKQLKIQSRMRSELVIILNTPRTTIYDNLEALLKANLIKRVKVITGKAGRPPIKWTLN